MKEKSNEGKLYQLEKKVRKALYYNTTIQIIDNDKAIVENCKHIIGCNDIMVKLKTADYYIEIWGQDLTVNDFNTENVVINGKISKLEIIPKGKADRDDL